MLTPEPAGRGALRAAAAALRDRQCLSPQHSAFVPSLFLPAGWVGGSALTSIKYSQFLCASWVLLWWGRTCCSHQLVKLDCVPHSTQTPVFVFFFFLPATPECLLYQLDKHMLVKQTSFLMEVKCFFFFAKRLFQRNLLFTEDCLSLAVLFPDRHVWGCACVCWK